MKGEPGQKGDRGPLGLPVSKENFPFQCKSQTFLSTLSNNSSLLGDYLTFEISVIGKHIILEQSSAQFCLMTALVSEEDPMTNSAVRVLSFSYIHANLPLLRLMIFLLSPCPLKRHCADYVIISPKCFYNLVQFRTLPQFFSPIDSKNRSPLLGGRYTISYCWWREVSAVAPYINQSYHGLSVVCVICFENALLWGSFGSSGG